MAASPPMLERRLRVLEDEQAVLRALHAYGQAIDYGDEEAFLDLFTEDAVLGARARRASGDVTRETRGREELARFAARFSRPPAGYHKHLVIEPLVDLDGDVATARSYLAVLREEDGLPLLWVFGRYRDRLVRSPDGRWRFRERIAEVESIDGRYASLAFTHTPDRAG